MRTLSCTCAVPVQYCTVLLLYRAISFYLRGGSKRSITSHEPAGFAGNRDAHLMLIWYWKEASKTRHFDRLRDFHQKLCSGLGNQSVTVRPNPTKTSNMRQRISRRWCFDVEHEISAANQGHRKQTTNSIMGTIPTRDACFSWEFSEKQASLAKKQHRIVFR